jgi:plasmid replication initiation protein
MKKDILKCHASLANDLLNSCYALTIVEKRIVLLLLARINSKENLSPTEWYTMDIVEYARIFNLDLKSSYDNLREAIERLYKRSIRKIEGKYITDFRWITAKNFSVEDKMLQVRWSDLLIPYISELTKCFTKLYIEDIVKIEGIYASRLYEMLYQEKWKGLCGTKEVSLEELHELWQLPESYKEFKELRRNVLTPAVKELAKKGLVLVDVGVRKEGRRVVGVGFSYCLKHL